MGFIQRSKSAAVTEHHSRKKTAKPAVPSAKAAAVDDEKRSTSFERPKTSTSFSRPRTANAAIGRSTDWDVPAFKIDIKAEHEIFSFPMPSPRLQPPPKGATGKKAPSPLRELGSPAIGVAIGSPSEAARPSWGRSITADSISPRMPAQPPPARAPPAIPCHPDFEESIAELKKKKAGWKGFSGLFGRRNTFVPVEEPCYKLKMPNAIEERDIIIPDLPELPERGTTPLHGHRRSSSLTRGQARLEARAEADRATFMRNAQAGISRSPLVIQKDSFSPMFRTINGLPEDDTWVDDPRKDSPLSMMSSKSFRAGPDTISVPDAPKLDLDLPDPKFERYSVMFEKLLEASGPSLLERRQSKINRARSIKRLDLSTNSPDRQDVPRLEVNGVPQRSATSPGLAKSLSTRFGRKVLSPVAEAFTALNRPRPIRCSKTAPSSATSPLAKTFPATNPRIEVRSTSPGSACLSEFSLPPTPMTIATISDSGSVEIITSDLESVRRSMLDTEPSWDMITSQPCEDGRDPYLRVKAPAKLEKHTVQVSVARQVSVISAMLRGREANESKQPMRARMVELGKERPSAAPAAAVLIKISKE